MRPALWLFLLLCFGTASSTHAQPILGIGDCIGNAQTVEVVLADPGPPTADGRRRVRVQEVLKGIDLEPERLLPDSTLQPGQQAVLVFPYQPPEPLDRNRLWGQSEPPIRVWRFNAEGKVDTNGIPPSGGSNWAPIQARPVELDLIRQAVVPEQVGLSNRVRAVLSAPANSPSPCPGASDEQTLFARLVVILLDLRRSPPPTADPGQRWPAVPADLELPPAEFPAPLLPALEKNDLDAFVPAFAAWLDSGLARDRIIQAITSPADMKLTEGSHLGYVVGWEGNWLPAPRMRPDVLLNQSIPAIDRMKVIAYSAQLFHYERFAKERQRAVHLLAYARPDNFETLRRAAFWEPDNRQDKYNAGQLAFSRLETFSDDPENERFLWNCAFLRDKNLQVVANLIRAGKRPYLDAAIAYVRDHRDARARSFAYDLWRRRDDRMVPILADWLKDPDPILRNKVGHILCITPTHRLVPELLAALDTETDKEARASLLGALAETGDKRGLEILWKELPNYDDRTVRPNIVRGLARIRDDRSLPVLADLVTSIPKEDSSYPEAIYAFLYITHDPDIWPPHQYGGSYGFESSRMKRGAALIDAWRKGHPASTPKSEADR